MAVINDNYVSILHRFQDITSYNFSQIKNIAQSLGQLQQLK